MDGSNTGGVHSGVKEWRISVQKIRGSAVKGVTTEGNGSLFDRGNDLRSYAHAGRTPFTECPRR
jgi:hypothetical protein